MSSTGRHRDDLPWWERDNRDWADAAEWVAFWLGAPVVVLLAVYAIVTALG